MADTKAKGKSKAKVVRVESGEPVTVVELPIEVAGMSTTIKNLLEDCPSLDVPIPLKTIPGPILEKVKDFCVYHLENPKPPVDTSDPREEFRIDNCTEWELEFFNLPDMEMHLEMIRQANFLEIKPLLDLGCKTMAIKVRGKTVDEIRTMFNLEPEFTPEEEQKIYEANSHWLDALKSV